MTGLVRRSDEARYFWIRVSRSVFSGLCSLSETFIVHSQGAVSSCCLLNVKDFMLPMSMAVNISGQNDYIYINGFPDGSALKNLPANVGDTG